MMMLDDCHAIGINQCLCLPKAELYTKNSTKRQQSCLLVEFWIFNSAFGKHSKLLILSTLLPISDRYGELML